MDINTSFKFPTNDGGEIKGISDTGIETFAGSPIKGLGRELSQNVLDANKDIEKPAIIEFHLYELDFSKMPGSSSLKDAFQRGLKFFSDQKSQKAKTFYKEALKKTSEKINILRVSDFNTTGLTGSRERYNTPWINLTKSSGISDKSGDNIGSFGIGKFASFAASSIRTVYYNTVDQEGYSAFQGISRLTSFELDNQSIAQGTGYYGAEEYKPIYENISLDPNYTREEDQYGTDIYIPAFMNLENSWKEEIIAAVVDGFMYAIFSEKLIVRVGNQEINKETLPNIIEEYEEYFEEKAHYFYRVLTSEDSHYFETNYQNGGLIKTWILLEDGLHNRTAFIRNSGMKIKEMKFHNTLLSGAAVVLIEGKGIQEVLIPLENPQHTDWEPKRAQQVPAARRYLRGIYNLVKDYLLKIQGDEDLLEVDSDVGEYLPLQDDGKDNLKDESISDEIKSVVKKEIIRPIKKHRNIMPDKSRVENITQDETGDETESAPSGHKKGNNPIKDSSKPNIHTPDDGFGNAEKKYSVKRTLVEVSKLRLIALNKEQGRYSLSFVPLVSADNSEIELKLIGETSDSNVSILNANMIPPKAITIDEGKITGLSLEKNESTRLIIHLDFNDYVAMEVKVNGIKK